MNLKTKINIKNMSELAFGIYIFMSLLANHTIFLHIATLFFIIMTTLFMVKRKKVYGSSYFFLTTLFVIYNIFLIKTNIAIYKSGSIKMTITLITNIIINYYIFNYIVLRKNIIKSLKCYSKAVLIGLFVILIFLFKDILVGRLGFGSTVNFLGVLLAFNSNMIGIYSSFTSLFYLYFYTKEKKIRYLFYILFLIFITLVTGSRKSLFFILFGSAIELYILFPKKRIKFFLIGLLAMGVSYLVIMKIDFFYNIIGSRIENLYILMEKGNVKDGSMDAREQMKEIGLYYFKKKPLTGYGLDSYRYLPKTWETYSHNNNVELLVSGGIYGLIIYYLPAIYMILRCPFKYIKDDVCKILLLINIFFLMTSPWLVSYFERPYTLFIVIMFAFFKLYKTKGIKKKILMRV